MHDYNFELKQLQTKHKRHFPDLAQARDFDRKEAKRLRVAWRIAGAGDGREPRGE